MTDAKKSMNPLLFRIDPADTRIRISLDTRQPKSMIQVYLAMAEVCALREHSGYYLFILTHCSFTPTFVMYCFHVIRFTCRIQRCCSKSVMYRYSCAVMKLAPILLNVFQHVVASAKRRGKIHTRL